MSKNLTSIAATLLILLAIGNNTQAGLISISNTTLSAGGSEVGGSGNQFPLFAWIANGNAAGTPTVNGVGFSNTQPSSVVLTGMPNTATDNAAVAAHYTGDMVEIMNDFNVTEFGADGTITISDLTVGKSYMAQFLHHRDIGNSGNAMRVHFGGLASDPSTGDFDPYDNQGFITTVNFTADAVSQDFLFNTIGGTRAVVNAVALYSVPEPSTFVLLGIGLVGIAMRRRR